MYGLVNKAVQDLIVERFGTEVWESIKRKAGLDLPGFISMNPYPDEMTYRLVGAASEELGIPAPQLLEAFGEFWTVYTAKEGYGPALTLAGDSLVEILRNLDSLHAQISLSFPELKPPSFRCTDITGDTARLHYYSHRPGLAPMVVGLVKGLGMVTRTEVQVIQDRYREQGDDHDEFIVRFQVTPAP